MKKYKKIVLSSLFVLLGIFTLAGVSNASSLTTNQIQAIINLLQTFGADSNTIAKVQVSLEGKSPSSTNYNSNYYGNRNNTSTTQASRQCVNLTHNLYLGKRDWNTNGEVSKLQRFLTQTGDYTYGQITGYYGPATVRAVQRWQRKHGVVSYGSPDTTGYGMVGPSTRKAMREACGVSGNNDPTIVPIHVTAPNGGEVWDMGYGKLHTITWTPYQYGSNPKNPSKDVDAYLDRKLGNGKFEEVGMVEPGGKASIHWYDTGLIRNSTGKGTWFADPGEYYIRVVNKKTGATDRSDRAFKLTNVSARLYFYNISDSNGKILIDQENDKVISNIPLDETIRIPWGSGNISDVSIALYKDNKWYKWIRKNVPSPGGNVSGSISQHFITWRPDSILGQSDIKEGAHIYQFYITGRKNNGGYIDAKSVKFGFKLSESSAAISQVMSQIEQVKAAVNKYVNINGELPSTCGLDCGNSLSDYITGGILNMKHPWGGHIGILTYDIDGDGKKSTWIVLDDDAPGTNNDDNSGVIPHDIMLQIDKELDDGNLATGDVVGDGNAITANGELLIRAAVAPELRWNTLNSGRIELKRWQKYHFTTVPGSRICGGARYVTHSSLNGSLWVGVASCDDTKNTKYSILVSYTGKGGVYYPIGKAKKGSYENPCEFVGAQVPYCISLNGARQCKADSMYAPRQGMKMFEYDSGKILYLKNAEGRESIPMHYQCGVVIGRPGAQPGEFIDSYYDGNDGFSRFRFDAQKDYKNQYASVVQAILNLLKTLQ